MPLARYHHLTLEATDLEVAARFWACALGYESVTDLPGGARVILAGDGPGARLDLVHADTPPTTSRRLHLDLHAGSVDELVTLGGTVVDDSASPWVVMHTPCGREVAVLLTEREESRLYHVVLDSPDPERIAAWYARVLGATLRPVVEDPDVAFIEPVPHAPFEAVVFARESEPKSEPNSSWMSLTTYDAHALELAGATRLGVDEEGRVRMADPDGNEIEVIQLARPSD